MLDYYEIILGVIFTLILSMVFGEFLGSVGSYSGFLIVTICVGYRVNIDMINGAIHGAVIAVLAGICAFIIMLIMWGFGVGPGEEILEFGTAGIIFGLLINSIIGAIGGFFGSAIRG